MSIISRFMNSFIFWAAWIIIPVLMEIVPSVGRASCRERV